MTGKVYYFRPLLKDLCVWIDADLSFFDVRSRTHNLHQYAKQRNALKSAETLLFASPGFFSALDFFTCSLAAQASLAPVGAATGLLLLLLSLSMTAAMLFATLEWVTITQTPSALLAALLGSSLFGHRRGRMHAAYSGDLICPRQSYGIRETDV